MLYGNLIKLVPLENEDLPNTHRWANDVELQKLILRMLPVTKTDQEAWYQNVVKDKSRLVFAVKTLAENRHIGNTGLYQLDWIHRRGELWLLLGDSTFWGRGIGTEVLRLLLNYAFDSLNLNKIFLHVDSENLRAIKLYNKFHFEQEGVLKEHYFMGGRYIDIIVMSLLRRDHGLNKQY